MLGAGTADRAAPPEDRGKAVQESQDNLKISEVPLSEPPSNPYTENANSPRPYQAQRNLDPMQDEPDAATHESTQRPERSTEEQSGNAGDIQSQAVDYNSPDLQQQMRQHEVTRLVWL